MCVCGCVCAGVHFIYELNTWQKRFICAQRHVAQIFAAAPAPVSAPSLDANEYGHWLHLGLGLGDCGLTEPTSNTPNFLPSAPRSPRYCSCLARTPAAASNKFSSSFAIAIEIDPDLECWMYRREGRGRRRGEETRFVLRESEWEAACKQRKESKAKATLGFNFSFVTVSDSILIKHSCVNRIKVTLLSATVQIKYM